MRSPREAGYMNSPPLTTSLMWKSQSNPGLFSASPIRNTYSVWCWLNCLYHSTSLGQHGGVLHTFSPFKLVCLWNRSFSEEQPWVWTLTQSLKRRSALSWISSRFESNWNFHLKECTICKSANWMKKAQLRILCYWARAACSNAEDLRSGSGSMTWPTNLCCQPECDLLITDGPGGETQPFLSSIEHQRKWRFLHSIATAPLDVCRSNYEALSTEAQN